MQCSSVLVVLVHDRPFPRIDMYVEGLRDLSDMIMYFPLSLPEEKEMNLEYILQRATTRFFPVYEKVSHDLQLASKREDG